jgi:alpha-D-xyloside xylohydrolase
MTGRTVYLPEGKWIDYQTGKAYEGGWREIQAGQLPIIMLVRDGSVLPHVALAQSTEEIDWSRMDLKLYAVNAKTATCLICLPSDGKLQTVKVDRSGRILSAPQGTKVKVVR